MNRRGGDGQGLRPLPLWPLPPPQARSPTHTSATIIGSLSTTPGYTPCRAFWRLWGQSYWPPENGVGDYRPVTMLGFAIEWAVGRGAPWAVHAGGLALYVLVVLAFWRLAMRVLDRRVAWAVAALFAVHPVHADVTANGVGQAELWAALWVILGVTLYIDWRREPASTVWSWRRIAALAGVYALACASKEHGVVFPMLLVAAEATIISGPRSRTFRSLRAWRGSPVSTDPCIGSDDGVAAVSSVRDLLRPAAALAITGAAYIVVRWIVTGSLRGDSPTFVLGRAPVATRLFTMLGAFPTLLSLLLWPARQAVEYMPQALTVYHNFDVALLWPAALLASLVAGAIAARRSAAVVTFGIAWVALTRLPASNISMPTGILLAPRVLFLPSAGALLAAGGIMTWVAKRAARGARDRTAIWWTPSAACLALLLVLGIWASESRARVWRDDLTLVSRTAVDAPRSYLARYQWGRALFQLGQPANGEREMRAAIALFPGDPRPYIELASEYAQAGMCSRAIVLYQQALTVLGTRPDAHAGLAECLARTGNYASARSHARIALGYGVDRSALRAILAQSDSAVRASSR